jgi:hypothetical protein
LRVLRNFYPLQVAFDGIRDGLSLIRLKRIGTLEAVSVVFQMPFLGAGGFDGSFESSVVDFRFPLLLVLGPDQIKLAPALPFATTKMRLPHPFAVFEGWGPRPEIAPFPVFALENPSLKTAKGGQPPSY